ncbi:MAG: TlpA family protein disulfide reductase [Deltaproteobacteria bacterium]|nr:TlpA family protein disulfide reductase [Deltaproteobacteria bacterium]
MTGSPIRLLTLVILGGLLAACTAIAPGSRPTSLPELSIPAPTLPAERNYLGLKDSAGHFSFNDLKSRLTVIEIIMAQCPHCQREAPKMDAFYRLLAERGLQDQVRIFAIALGNTPFETGLYKERYQVPFPIIPDPGGTLLRVDATPTLYIIEPDSGGGSRILHQEAGILSTPEELIEITQKLLRKQKTARRP